MLIFKPPALYEMDGELSNIVQLSFILRLIITGQAGRFFSSVASCLPCRGFGVEKGNAVVSPLQ